MNFPCTRWRRALLRSWLPSLLPLCAPAPLAAQYSVPLRTIGSIREDRVRMGQLTGGSTAGTLLRVGGDVDSAPGGLRVLRPEMRFAHQSQLPAPDNDGALWSGRGPNVLLRAGVTVGAGPLRITVAPELAYSANEPFEVRSVTVAGRSAFASPWRSAEGPADLPVRFGDQQLAVLLPGQSMAALRFSSVTVGMMTGNLWWGPGLRNALVLSDHAPGIPRLTVRTTTPRRTPVGDLEGELFVGRLTESPYFDDDPSNDQRRVKALALTLAPRGLPGLTLGAGGLVISRDQMATAFFRWVVPEAGVEFWGEYARHRLPASPREMFTQPNADMGWTAGAQWLLPQSHGAWRFQLEFSDVAQSLVDPSRPPRDWGTGATVIHGFTQRGQLLGPATGPGSTTGWFAADRVQSSWSVGAFAARTRWENDAFYRQRIVNFFAHDVSLIGGIRAQWRTPALDLGSSVGWERRFNYQFENATIIPNRRGQRTYDNLRLSLALTPR